MRPFRKGGQRPVRGAEQSTAIVVEQGGGFIVDRQGTRREKEFRALGQLSEVAGARFQSGHPGDEKLTTRRIDVKPGRYEVSEPRVVRLPNVMAVQILQLLEVEPRRAFADMVEVEPLDRLLQGDDLIVPMAPAEPEQVIDQRL